LQLNILNCLLNLNFSGSKLS